ncbi:MAG: cytochrome c-type biogenesis protein CcmH [Legionellaceae bacterium]|nr:cytochrome c-type biogenesis protein CcmH [Legionellaceae bacterium]
MKRAIVFIFLLPMFSNSLANTLYPFDNPRQTAQFNHLLYDLRCPVCQNQDLADSNAGLAQDLRQEVYQLVTDGKTDDEIVRYMTARYGDFILFKPPVKAVTLLLWFGPFLFIIIGLMTFYYTCIRRAKHASV